ncbi:MAG: ATP-binding protein [Desulfohalobiaceae bacterium]
MNKATAYWQNMKSYLSQLLKNLQLPQRYQQLQRNIFIVMLFITITPLTLMALINAILYQQNIKSEEIKPIRSISSKATHSFELFIEERLSAIKFIASSYSFGSLSEQKTMHRVFSILQENYGGFVDLGLINNNGIQVSYAGPYDLLDKNYARQDWLQKVHIEGQFVSDVFMGFREQPHIALAVEHLTKQGKSWVLRATMDTQKFEKIIDAVNVPEPNDVFLVNNDGILQTDSQFYGNVLDKFFTDLPDRGPGTHVIEDKDPLGRKVFIIYSPLIKHDMTLAIVLPQTVVLESWHTLKKEMVLILIISVLIIVLSSFLIATWLVKRIREADEKREAAFRELEYSQKLSSIGRLAAGIAHEINNPLSIINEKAGLLQDLIENDIYYDKKRLLNSVNPIIQSVSRTRDITQRLLGFARRIETQYEMLDINKVLIETVGFLENEANHRNITIEKCLDPNLPAVHSDRGQLQQVFLNIITNAISAEKNGGRIVLSTKSMNEEHVEIAISDNGQGMTKQTMRHIFEPFFTTKKHYGTGLGLSITYGIVKKLGGEIKVESKLNIGSTFTVILPTKASGAENES